MPHKRPNEPIAPATIPGQPLDPKIPPDQTADGDDDADRDLDHDIDDDVGTDERGKEMLSLDDRLGINQRTQAPDAVADRIASPNAGAAPLRIREIETLEDDAKGG